MNTDDRNPDFPDVTDCSIAAPLRRAVRWRLLGVFCLAALLRIVLIIRYNTYDNPETFEFGVLATSLLEGRGFGGPAWFFRDEPGPTAMAPPLYAFFLAGCLAVFPSDAPYLWIQLVQVALSAVVVLPVWTVTRRIFGEPAAWMAAVLVALDYFLACTPGWINYPVMHVLLLAVIVWLGYRLLDKPTFSRSAVFGVVAGIATLNKSLVAVYVVLFSVWIVLAGRSQRWPTRFMMLLLAAGLSLAVLSPWITRNWLVFHAFLPAGTNSGIHLWIGNNSAATGGLYALDGRPVTDHVPDDLRKRLRGHNEAEQSRIFAADARQWAKEHPKQWLMLRAKAFVYFCTEQNFWLPDSFYVANQRQTRPNPALVVLTFAMLTCAGVGFLLTLNKWRQLMPLYLLVLSYASVYSLIHADITNRFRLPIEPWLLVLAAGGAMRVWSLAKRTAFLDRRTAGSHAMNDNGNGNPGATTAEPIDT